MTILLRDVPNFTGWEGDIGGWIGVLEGVLIGIRQPPLATDVCDDARQLLGLRDDEKEGLGVGSRGVSLDGQLHHILLATQAGDRGMRGEMWRRHSSLSLFTVMW